MRWGNTILDYRIGFDQKHQQLALANHCQLHIQLSQERS